MKTSKKVLIVITKMGMGGFSKSLINFLICAQKYSGVNFSLLMLDDEKMELEKDIPNNAKVIKVSNADQKISFKNKIKLRYHRYKYSAIDIFSRKILKKATDEKYLIEYVQTKLKVSAESLVYDFSFTKEYDAIISWEEGYCNYVVAEAMPANRKIGFIHPNYLEAHFHRKTDKTSLKKLDSIVTISNSCYDTLREVFPEFKEKIVYIPNRLSYDNLFEKSKEYVPEVDKECLSLLTVARISDYNKAVFRIVELSKKLRDNGVNFKWYVIGNGSDLDEMQKRIQDSELIDVVLCLGEKVNPCPYMANVDLFVMQSHIEGRPVAVDEALLLGTPALITNYSSCKEQICENGTGWIVEDDFDAIYNKLYDILTDSAKLSLVKNNLNMMDKMIYEDCSQLIDLAIK